MKDARKFKTKPRMEIITASVAKDFNGAQEVKSGRKRKRNPSNSKAAIQKQRRNRGKSYSPCLKKGHDEKKRIKKKEINQPCPESCKGKCRELVSPDDREAIFSKYWDIDDVEKQWQFITNNAQVKPKQRSRGRDNTKRQNSMTYYLNGHAVCKRMFLNTLSMTKKFVSTSIQKSKEGFNRQDLRGKMGNTKFCDDAVNEVIDHIKSSPIMVSHYVREQTNHHYMSSDLNAVKSYTFYREKKTMHKVGEQTFRNIFNEKFNIGFHKPKKDQCEVCIEFQNATPDKLPDLNEKHTNHQVNKTVARELKSNYKLIAAEDTTLKCYAFDLQKVLHVPYGEHSSYYYKRNFAVYNLTVTDLHTKQGYCYIWDPNKNVNDSVHACIEKAKIGINIHHPYQWETLIEMSCKSKPCHVKYLTQENMLNFNVSNTINALMFSGKPVNMQGKLTKIYWSKFRHIQFIKPQFSGGQYVLCILSMFSMCLCRQPLLAALQELEDFL